MSFGWLFHFVLAVFSAWNLIEAMRRPRWRLWGLVVALWLVITVHTLALLVRAA